MLQKFLLDYMLSLSYISSYMHVHPGYREKNLLICKAHLWYTCDFITEFKGRTGPAMKIEVHIFSACTKNASIFQG